MLRSYKYILACLTCFLFTQFNNLQAQNAIYFDGNNDYVQTTFDGVVGSADRTFEAWIKISSNATANSAILDYGLNAVGSRNTFLVNPSNGITFISGGTNANIGSTTNVITSEVWTHVAFVLDNGTGYLYVNGSQVGTGNLSNVNTPSSNTDLRIGERVPGGTIPFEGAIDEVRIWDYARTATEISNDMNAEICVLDSHLVAYHKFNHGIAGGSNSAADTSYDASGNGNHGDLTNIALTGSTSNWVTGSGISTSALTNTISASACDGSYTSPSGNYTWTQAGIYTDTIQSIMACDSILTINLTLASSSTKSISVSECLSYESPSGFYTWTQSGTYMDTLVNAVGCDSVLTIDLSINNSSSEFTVDACDNYVLPSGAETGPFSGTYLDTISNAAGCDSTMIIHVNIHYPTSSSITVNACNSYNSPSGMYEWTMNGTYTDTVVAANGCDSVITINLTVDSVNSDITKAGNTLSAVASGAIYQWMDCSDSTLISDESGQTYSPTKTGEYAVIVTQNGCTDTSECKKVTIVGVNEVAALADVTLFPNPSKGNMTIDFGREYKNASISILSIDGKVVYAVDKLTSSQVSLDLDQPAGIYTIILATENGVRTFPVMKVE